MSHPLVYLGLDVGKTLLVGQLAGRRFSHPNTPAGRRALCARITQHPAPVQVICEATGGYERPVLAALNQAGHRATRLHATRARQLALGLGFLAKTDALDAAALVTIGTRLQPAPTPAPDPAQQRLAALVRRRDQLVELARREKQHAEQQEEADLRRDLQQSLAALARRVAKIEALITRQLADHPALQAKAERLQQAPGVAAVGAATLLAFLPELGQGAAARLASLAGLAPRNYDSGAFRGERHIGGGRAKVRRILYLCALSAARHSVPLRSLYQRLRANGKAPKVALVAVARKLLTYLHYALKDPNFTFA